MMRLWQQASARFEAMTLRERVLAGAAAAVLPAFLIYAVYIGPAQTRQRVLRAEAQKQQAQIAALEQEIRGDGPQPGAPNAQRPHEIEARKQLANADEALKAMQRTLVPAQRMPVLMREMLARDPALQLVSLRTLPAMALMPEADKAPPPKGRARPEAEGAAPPRGVYKHGVEIVVRGTYSALHAYLARLEHAPSTMYWWRAQLAADERTALTLTVTIHTLSLDKGWLEV